MVRRGRGKKNNRNVCLVRGRSCGPLLFSSQSPIAREGSNDGKSLRGASGPQRETPLFGLRFGAGLRRPRRASRFPSRRRSGARQGEAWIKWKETLTPFSPWESKRALGFPPPTLRGWGMWKSVSKMRRGQKAPELALGSLPFPVSVAAALRKTGLD